MLTRAGVRTSVYTRERVSWEGEEQIDTHVPEKNPQHTSLCILLIGAAHRTIQIRYAHAVGGFLAELKNVSIDGERLEGKVAVGIALIHRLGGGVLIPFVSHASLYFLRNTQRKLCG